jgi:hypothetical protein
MAPPGRPVRSINAWDPGAGGYGMTIALNDWRRLRTRQNDGLKRHCRLPTDEGPIPAEFAPAPFLDQSRPTACRPLNQYYLEVMMKRSERLAKATRGKKWTAFERRLFSYTDFIPERRSGRDRRDVLERRQFSYSNFIPERRSGRDRRHPASPYRGGNASSARFSEEKWVGGRQPRL